MDLAWNGATLRSSHDSSVVQARDEIADHAREGRWRELLERLSVNPRMTNAWRLGGKTWFTPLHQAAYLDAPLKVIDRLLGLGAWRTLRNAAGERPLDVATQRGHDHLRPILTPVQLEPVSDEALDAIQRAFHDVIQARAGRLVSKHHLQVCYTASNSAR
jgi:hypothetical protein